MLLNNSKTQDPFDDSILNIERLLKGNMIQNIEIHEDSLNSNGEIVINYKLNNNKPYIKKKKIFFDSFNKKIVLETYNKNDFRIGVNIIMLDICQFKIVKKNNIYYLKIINGFNDERILCL